ncbi:MAG: PilZ domain-containing protein [Candidatus Omnitrophica bacterium]|nr:PilZ domain-containing protein [Candidatus Omnitrophota bacterium]MDD5660541.1 PilZ domain-containing protein [Candidatus Omnitrophota bacterium]
MTEERRKARRFLLNLSLSKINIRGVSGKVLDFSRKGMKIMMDAPEFDEKPDIQIYINRPDYNHQIPVIAYVVWVKHSDGKCVVGLKFKKIPIEAKVDLVKFGYSMWLKNKSSRQQ